MSRQDDLMFQTSISGSGELDGDDILVLNLRVRLNEIADVEAEKLRASVRRRPIDKELRRLAFKIYSDRRLRDRLVEDKLFGEPAWDMLLALYCLPPRGQLLSVTGLSYAANTEPTTGLRWQKTLATQGLIERGPKGVDKRKQFIRLTSAGRQLMDRILTRLHSVEPKGHSVDRPDSASAPPGRTEQVEGSLEATPPSKPHS